VLGADYNGDFSLHRGRKLRERNQGRKKPNYETGKTICPSVSARRVSSPISYRAGWRTFCFMNTKQTSYSEKLRDPRWQKKRLCVMQRDGFACRDCGDEKSTLQVHHCRYEKGYPWEIENQFLLTLCESCHERRGAIEKEVNRALQLAMAHMPIYAIEFRLMEQGPNSFTDWGHATVGMTLDHQGEVFREQLNEWRLRRDAAKERAKSNE